MKLVRKSQNICSTLIICRTEALNWSQCSMHALKMGIMSYNFLLHSCNCLYMLAISICSCNSCNSCNWSSPLSSGRGGRACRVGGGGGGRVARARLARLRDGLIAIMSSSDAVAEQTDLKRFGVSESTVSGVNVDLLPFEWTMTTVAAAAAKSQFSWRRWRRNHSLTDGGGGEIAV